MSENVKIENTNSILDKQEKIIGVLRQIGGREPKRFTSEVST